MVVHFSLLNCFCFALCLSRTSSLTTIFLRYILHDLISTFAPWLRQTPPKAEYSYQCVIFLGLLKLKQLYPLALGDAAQSDES